MHDDGLCVVHELIFELVKGGRRREVLGKGVLNTADGGPSVLQLLEGDSGLQVEERVFQQLLVERLTEGSGSRRVEDQGFS